MFISYDVRHGVWGVLPLDKKVLSPVANISHVKIGIFTYRDVLITGIALR